MITLEEEIKSMNILSMVGHDIKSPLNGILGYASLIAEESSDIEIKKMAMQIQKGGIDILFLVNNLMTMLRMEAGSELPDFRWVHDVKDEIEEIIRTFSIEANSKKIKIELNITEPITKVYWDMERLRLHVFNNLISNALKFTPHGGNIRISAHKIGSTVRFFVEDNGPGIDWKHRETVFESFRHPGIRMSARTMEGHGFGLYNARLFVERHGGLIYLDRPVFHDLVDDNTLENNFYGDRLSGARFVMEMPIFPKRI